jgi:formylglycine-generating enzyme required for sulfatase activity
VDSITQSRANYFSATAYAFDLSTTRGYHPTFNDGVYPYTSPAGYFAANGYGLYDMAGNVWEWCWDWYGSYSSDSQTDPRGPASGWWRVVRGGSWGDDAIRCRSANRFSPNPTYSDNSFGFRCVRGLPADTNTVPLSTGTDTNTVTVLIPAGSFTMGDSLDGDENCIPQHSVSVSAFFMDKYLVTKSLWDTVKAWNGGNGYGYDNAGSGKAPTHPVQTVNWYDVVKWCNARSQMEGLQPCYYADANMAAVYKSGQMTNPRVKWSASGYRLPTEAEWEKAARGGASGHRFPWSDVDSITQSRANYFSATAYAFDLSTTRGYHPTFNDGVYPYTSPVGYFAANGYGLYDMAGNVWEWCWDWYGSYSSDSQTDPRGPASGWWRVVRGGSWNNDAIRCRSANRFSPNPTYSDNESGFRCVRAPSQ